MRITSVDAAAITNARPFGRTEVAVARWQSDMDHMNPLGGDPRYSGQSDRFTPPWSQVLCVVTADDGSFGLGMSSLAGVTVPMINEFLGPMVRGEYCGDVERLWAMMTAASRAHFGLSGPVTYAISAVDLALWDLRGKLEGEPVWSLLGGDGRRSPVPCYATGMGVSDLASYGFEAFKLACPWGPDRERNIEQVLQHVRHARSTIAPGVKLMLDCWAVDIVDDAIAIAQAVEGFGLSWIEDAIRPDDWRGYRRLRDAVPNATLAAGERWYSVETFEQALDEAWVDVVQPDALWLGGATPTAIVADRAARSGVGFALHCGANDGFGQHLAYGLAANQWAEMYICSPPGASLMDSYRATPGMALPINGRIRPTDAPGFGIELNLRQIQEAIG